MTSEDINGRHKDHDLVHGVALGELGVHIPTAAAERRIQGAAREAFSRAVGDVSRSRYALASTALSTALARAVMPSVLASVVGIYLLWAFGAAIALNQ